MGSHSRKEFAVITGGTSGIGYATATHFLENDYGVVIMYGDDRERADQKRRQLEEMGYRVNDDFYLIQADVGNSFEISNALKAVEEIYSKISVLINNAGALRRMPFEDLTDADWQSVFGVNVFGVSNMAQWFKLHCSAARAIVNIGSIRGLPHVSRLDNMIYSVSKACIPTLTAVLAKQLGPQIRVVALVPGTIDTPQRQGITEEEYTLYGESNTIQNRLGTPNEIAEICLFLVSEKAAYITGTSITVDGGYSINYIR